MIAPSLLRKRRAKRDQGHDVMKRATEIRCLFIATVSLIVFQLLLPTTTKMFAAYSFQPQIIQPKHLVPATTSAATTTTIRDSTVLWMGKKRMARKKQDRSRPKTFYDAIEDAGGPPKRETISGKKSGGILIDEEKAKSEANVSEATKTTGVSAPTDEEEIKEAEVITNDVIDLQQEQLEAQRQKAMAEAQRKMDERPEVSTVIVDKESGSEVVLQGKKVMDVVTRQAVKLSDLGPQYRLAQFFPGVPPDIRAKYRFKDWSTMKAEDMIEKLREACVVKQEDGTMGIPKHPSVANKALDFVLANRDYMGSKMKRALCAQYMCSLSSGDKEKGMQDLKLSKNFMTIENHLSAPFRQMLQDAESRIGPQFGNLDVLSFCKGEMYERCANYLVLKGMVAHWEKKVVDADYIEKNPLTKDSDMYLTILSHGDPRRFLPDPPVLFTLTECTRVCYMAQQMTKAFVENEALFGDLPPEIRFLEEALMIRGGTPLRKFVATEFCPREEITPVALREGVRRLICQLDNMQIDPYADLTNMLERMCSAMSFGTEDEKCPFNDYFSIASPNGPGGNFQTYTHGAHRLSMARFLDRQFERESESAAKPKTVASDFFGFGGSGGNPRDADDKDTDDTGSGRGLFDDDNEAENEKYDFPPLREMGRPHDLGWLKLLDEDLEREGKMKFGQVQPGRIIPDEE